MVSRRGRTNLNGCYLGQVMDSAPDPTRAGNYMRELWGMVTDSFVGQFNYIIVHKVYNLSCSVRLRTGLAGHSRLLMVDSGVGHRCNVSPTSSSTSTAAAVLSCAWQRMSLLPQRGIPAGLCSGTVLHPTQLCQRCRLLC